MKPEVPHNIFLTGFMGAGKSTVGKFLADVLNRSFADLDSLIVQQEHRSIAEIFAEDGESYFRDCESALLASLPEKPEAVYATGGGLVIREENCRLLSHLGLTVYLKSSWPVLKKRLQQSQDRPIVNNANGWDEIKELWSKRLPFYERADIVVDTDGLNPSQVVQKIILELLP